MSSKAQRRKPCWRVRLPITFLRLAYLTTRLPLLRRCARPKCSESAHEKTLQREGSVINPVSHGIYVRTQPARQLYHLRRWTACRSAE